MSDFSDTKIIPVILSGGSGTRLWPLSRAALPKQFLPLCDDRSLFDHTIARVDDADMFADPLIICAQAHRFIVRDILGARQSGARLMMEPCARNTAPALAAASLAALARDADAVVLVCPSDHYIPDDAAFRRTVAKARGAVREGRIALFGIAPREAHTGFGYIERGGELPGYEDIFAIQSFTEKPDAATARGLIDQGGYYWNSGIFLMRAADYWSEIERLAPDIANHVRDAWEGRQNDLGDDLLDADHFAKCPAISIDYAVMEHTDKGCVVPAAFAWDDLGSWEALWSITPRDGQTNTVCHGDVVASNVRNSYLRSEGGGVLCAVDVDNIVAVSTQDAVLIAPRDGSQEVSRLVKELKQGERPELFENPKVLRPWGAYETMDEGQGFKVKRITVEPGKKLSLQKHGHRAEHWVVVSGTARVTCGEDVFDLQPNQSTYIPQGSVHRLENPCDDKLELVEVQTGDYLGEDDIIRLDDVYGRETLDSAKQSA